MSNNKSSVHLIDLSFQIRFCRLTSAAADRQLQQQVYFLCVKVID